jgi:hypothetical protein
MADVVINKLGVLGVENDNGTLSLITQARSTPATITMTLVTLAAASGCLVARFHAYSLGAGPHYIASLAASDRAAASICASVKLTADLLEAGGWQHRLRST